MFLNQDLSSKITFYDLLLHLFFKSYINTTFNRVKVSLNIWKISLNHFI
jgi:hypothetical protein